MRSPFSAVSRAFSFSVASSDGAWERRSLGVAGWATLSGEEEEEEEYGHSSTSSSAPVAEVAGEDFSMACVLLDERVVGKVLDFFTESHGRLAVPDREAGKEGDVIPTRDEAEREAGGREGPTVEGGTAEGGEKEGRKQ